VHRKLLRSAVKNEVPIYPLDVLADAPLQLDRAPVGVFMFGQRVVDVQSAFGSPYRSNYYGVGICLQGQAKIAVDLEEYVLRPNTVLAIPPHTIKQWRFISGDFKHIVIFFTKAFVTEENSLDLDHFSYFERDCHLITLGKGPANEVRSVLQTLETKYRVFHPYRDQILRSLINVLLYELETFSRQRPSLRKVVNRGRRLTADFKLLVKGHFASKRNVAFYARALSITPRHLSATIQEQTGKTAGKWIEETVILEARVLLQDASQTISQIADTLHFSDVSAFGKFFKKHVGVSPRVYRKGGRGRLTF
jgi:AraC family transcriptional activator of pobA